MKELTIKEKAQRYDEAIKIAKSNYETIMQMDKDCTFAKEGIVNTFHHIFPELKESEDEKIRESLLEYLHTLPNHYAHSGVCAPEWIAWLEKQSKTFTKKDINDAYLKGVCDAKQELEKQGEHQHLNDNFPSFDEAQGTIIVEKQSEQNLIMAKSPQLGEQKPAENKGMNLVEEEMTSFQKKVFCIIDTAIEEKQGLKQVCDELFALASNEIKKKNVWSEEDENRINRLIAYFEDKESFTAEDDVVYANWLKSLSPQSHRKPSDKHYELEEFAKIVRGNLTGINKDVQELFEAKYLQLTGNKMYGGYKD